MEVNEPIIRTKLHLPFTRPELVARPRLQEQVERGLLGPLTLITAPAGFGKTSVAATAVADCGMPVAWLSLDQNDNQSGRFLAYLVAAIQKADKNIGCEAAQITSVMQEAPYEAVLTCMINDLDASTQDFVLVLDDYQFITNPEVHTQMAFLLEHCPGTLHIILATRSDPQLPLARLRARGQLIELRAADLRFTPAEAAQFLNGVMGLDLDAESVSVLEERTEGWIAGLQMAALSMRDCKDVPGFIRGFSGTNRFILDYLLEEILASQPPEIQRFLLNTSILERLSGSLCDALLSIVEPPTVDPDAAKHDAQSPSPFESAAVLQTLDRKNLFLVALDDEHVWFRYHHLFADLLKARLVQNDRARVPLLHIRASTWFEENGLIPEAIQHLFAAHAEGRAADLIEPNAPLRWAKSDASIVQMADALPYDLLLARPKLGLYEVWLLICRGQIQKAIALMKDLLQQLDSPETTTGTRWMRTMISTALAFLTGPQNVPGFDPIRDYPLLDEMPPEDLVLRNAADILYGMLLSRMGENDLAIETSIRCIQRERALRGTQAIPTLAPFLARMYFATGQLHATHSLCREFLDPINEKNVQFISTAGSLNAHLGEVLMEWNRLAEAEKHIRDGLRANEPWKNIMTDGFGMTALVRVLQAKGDIEGAMQAMDRFETRMSETSHPSEFNEDLNTLRVRLYLAAGDLQRAGEWADRIDGCDDPKLQDQCRLVLARVRLAQQRFADAEKLLKGRDLPVNAGNRTAKQIEANLIVAAALAGQQRSQEAVELVESSLALGEPEGYIHTFMDVGKPARQLLEIYLHAGSPAHVFYARTLQTAFALPPNPEPAPSQPGGLIDPLTERELEILHLLAAGLTNPEIARRLIISPGTVKAHTASIYRKLEASNRTEAAARARQLGILA